MLLNRIVPTFVFFTLTISAFSCSANTAPTPLDSKRQSQLIHLLKQDCGSCHGMTLKGGLGPALLPENLQGKPDLFLQNTILMGRPGTAMPPWQGLLTEQEAQWLIKQLRQGIKNEQ
ncbi:c-type cytochrome [Thalassotalea sp. PLHSN55]|uniref:c-type cytochrome n=1 Tax=Thalassotalea sp. PLHSN55 TaxID=3435888 RepID=UPI003F855511